MNRYQLIRGFETHEAAADYAARLPAAARARVVPYRGDVTLYGPGAVLFAVDVSREYTGGRL